MKERAHQSRKVGGDSGFLTALCKSTQIGDGRVFSWLIWLHIRVKA